MADRTDSVPTRLAERWTGAEGRAYGGLAIFSDRRTDPVAVVQHATEADLANILATPRTMSALIALYRAVQADQAELAHIPGALRHAGSILREVEEVVQGLTIED